MNLEIYYCNKCKRYFYKREKDPDFGHTTLHKENDCCHCPDKELSEDKIKRIISILKED